jgi:sulfite reductase beta subunit-like hemoprotein
VAGQIREGYQLFVGGRLGRRVRMADRIGRFDAAVSEDVVRTIVELYVKERRDGEELADVVERLRPQAVAAHLAARMPEAFVASLSDEGGSED